MTQLQVMQAEAAGSREDESGPVNTQMWLLSLSVAIDFTMRSVQKGISGLLVCASAACETARVPKPRKLGFEEHLKCVWNLKPFDMETEKIYAFIVCKCSIWILLSSF